MSRRDWLRPASALGEDRNLASVCIRPKIQ